MKFTITLTLSNQDAHSMQMLWDKTDIPSLIKKAMEEFCIERYDAEQFIFRKFGIRVFDQEDWKNKISLIKHQYMAAKILQRVEVEECVETDQDKREV